VAALDVAVRKHLAELCTLDLPDLLNRRYDRYRALGRYAERKP
jgi:acetyl-CoA carboxylase alpha subunit